MSRGYRKEELGALWHRVSQIRGIRVAVGSEIWGFLLADNMRIRIKVQARVWILGLIPGYNG